jgi:predicted CXXCH cytochrome family protein
VSVLALIALSVTSLALAAPKRGAARFPSRTIAEIPAIAAQGGHADACDACHTAHGQGAEPQPGLLLAPNDNQLCATCHDQPWTTKSFPGLAYYTGSAHGANPNVIWPGPDPPARMPGDAGMCRNCHDPHGYDDASGLIPRLTLQREEKLCLNCHDGAPAATNIMSDFQKPYRHPTLDYTGRHQGPGETTPEAYGRTPANQRHAECEDCHDPHTARADQLGGPVGSDASHTTLGASRVSVLNGIAGSLPMYTYLPASDTTSAPNAEYELCFKCHSSWTTAPAGQTDMAKVLNPANPSFHPVEAPGTNPNISPLAFTSGWTASSTTRCGDCHGSDFGLARGPHGSMYKGILKAPYDATPTFRSMASNELCFSCHSYDVYANPGAPSSVLSASRFNSPGAGKGHADHVSGENVPCVDCHITHGSTTLPNLLVTGRLPGLNSYTRTATGGTCAPSCHGSESYTVNYAR